MRAITHGTSLHVDDRPKRVSTDQRSVKTELIKPRKPWRTIEEVALATADWVQWFIGADRCGED